MNKIKLIFTFPDSCRRNFPAKFDFPVIKKPSFQNWLNSCQVEFFHYNATGIENKRF